MDDEQQLRALIEERVTAVRAKDPVPLAARQANDVLSFGVLPPLRSRGGDDAEQTTRAWFDLYEGPIGYEVREEEVRVSGDVGFCSFLYHVSGTQVGGTKVSMWVRATLRLREARGQVAHRPRPRICALRPRERRGAPRPGAVSPRVAAMH